MGLFTSKTKKELRRIFEEAEKRYDSMSEEERLERMYQRNKKEAQELEERIEKYGRTYLTEEEKQEYETGTFTIEVDGEEYTFGWKDVATEDGFGGLEQYFSKVIGDTYNVERGKSLIKELLTEYIRAVKEATTIERVYEVVDYLFGTDLSKLSSNKKKFKEKFKDWVQFGGHPTYPVDLFMSLRLVKTLEEAKKIALDRNNIKEYLKIHSFPKEDTRIVESINLKTWERIYEDDSKFKKWKKRR